MLIPDHALPLALSLLAEMNAVANPTEDQRRFIGTLRKAAGIASNNAIHKSKKENAK